MNVIAWLRSNRPSAPAALLFTALLAQAPHAAAVFARVAPHGAEWERWASIIGAIVYAVALESATAYFVWRNQRKWAIAFAAFSIAHNVAYYMPAEWTLILWGATLQWRNVAGSVLISISLPIAIAAFSHVQSESDHSSAGNDDGEAVTPAKAPAKAPAPEATPTTTTAAPTEAPRPATPPSEAISEASETADDAKPAAPSPLTPAQRRAHIVEQELTDPAQVAAIFNVSRRTAQGDLAAVREAMTQTNGKVQHA